MSGGQLLKRISIEAGVCHGKPVIRGLRYPVESILESLVAGDSIQDILDEFEDLEEADILACLTYATATVKGRGSVTVPYKK